MTKEAGQILIDRCAKNRPHENHLNSRLQDAQSAQRTGTLVADHAREAQGPGCPVVRFTLCRVRLLDIDAKYGSVKDLLDGLQYAGLIHGDKEGQIDLQVHQTKVAHYAAEKTVIEINP